MSNILDKIQLSGTTYDLIDSTAIHSLDGYWTSGQTNNAITAATNALAESIAEQGYQTSGDVQNAISGKVDTDTYTAYTAATEAVLSGKAETSDIPSVTPYADSVKYNSTSKEVEFYHGGTGGTKVFSYDASPFLIDGMVQNVEIKDVTISGESVTCLVISFNTDAGKQDINVPLTDIFDANNYYTKTEVDNAITAATDGLAVATAVTQEISEATSGKADTSDVITNIVADPIQNSIGIKYTKGGSSTSVEVMNTGSGLAFNKSTKQLTVDTTTIQEKLTSGTNIKTVNGNSLLGSGDITVQTLPTINGTTLVFS